MRPKDIIKTRRGALLFPSDVREGDIYVFTKDTEITCWNFELDNGIQVKHDYKFLKDDVIIIIKVKLHTFKIRVPNDEEYSIIKRVFFDNVISSIIEKR